LLTRILSDQACNGEAVIIGHGLVPNRQVLQEACCGIDRHGFVVGKLERSGEISHHAGESSEGGR
jgi:hypothetical protein